MGSAPRIDELDKNFIINGNFDFWQRNTTFGSLAQYAYNADRWCNFSGANTSASIAMQSVGGLIGTMWSERWLRWTAGSVTSQFNVAQAIEARDAVKLRGRTVTFSVWARVNSGNVRPYFINILKSTTSNATNTTWTSQAATTPVALTTDWQQLYVTTTLASDNSVNGLAFAIRDNSVGLATDYVEIAQAQVVPQSLVPSAFSYAGRSYSGDLMLCMRFFEKTYPLDRAVGSAGSIGDGVLCGRVIAGTTSNNDITTRWQFSVPKRSIPIMTWYNPNSGAIGTWRNDVPADVSAITISGGTSEFGSGVSNLAGITTAFHRIHGTADAEI